MISRQMRYRGSLVGLAAGDALGATVEFEPPGTFRPMAGMFGGGALDLEPSQWTDATSMALCLAESLIECDGFYERDQMDKYVLWKDRGYMSPVGTCFDCGRTVEKALKRYKTTGESSACSADPRSAGNGSLMRLAPAPLFYATDPEEAVRISGESSRATHGARTCVDACRYYGGLIVGVVNGASKDELLSPRYSPVKGLLRQERFEAEAAIAPRAPESDLPVKGLWEQEPLCEEIAEIADGSFRRKEPPADPLRPGPDDIVGTGYAVRSLEAALWAFDRTSDFAEGCLLAATLSGGANATPAIYGQLAGAYYGFDGIPERWRELVAGACGNLKGGPSLIVDIADGLMRGASGAN